MQHTPILGRIHTLQYLNKLDLFTSRYLIKECDLNKNEVKKVAYFLGTYAIELRAEEFYPIYEQVLWEHRSNVYVKSIILEEEHLREFEEGIVNLDLGI